MPPEDAINQLHRYRDAIYYTGDNKGKDISEIIEIKKEVIGGYVLFPGNVPPEAYEKDSDKPYWFQQSNDRIGIGAFPLRPERHDIDEEGKIIIDPSRSEQALYIQIKKWIEEENMLDALLEQSIPQKGLEYTNEPVIKGAFFLSDIDTHVNDSVDDIVNGKATAFYSGYSTIFAGIDFQKIKYFAPVHNHIVNGYYMVSKVEITSMAEQLNKKESELHDKYGGYANPIRVVLHLTDYQSIAHPFNYGIRDAYRGVNISRKKFNELSRDRAK